MDCTPAAIARASRCWCLKPQQARMVMVYLLCQWLKKNRPLGSPILSNGAGGFCQLVVDITGKVGAQPSAGPATSPAPVIADGVGGFWQVVTDSACNRGTTSVAGPATALVVLIDANSVAWTLTVDSSGNLGATS